MSQVSQCPSGIVNTTAYIIGMWRDVSSSFGTLFSDAITACFCDYMQSITVMPRQDSPVSILKRSLQLWPPIVVSVPVLGSRGLGHVVDDILFESLLWLTFLGHSPARSKSAESICRTKLLHIKGG